MRDIDLHEAYGADGTNVKGLFAPHEEGFFVPMYQRHYTWEEEQIDQFLDDLVLGIRELSKDDGQYATTFLGTVILTSVGDTKSTVKKGEFSAQPTAIQYVVDGQQRISTIALFAIQLSNRIRMCKSKLPDETPYSILINHCNGLISDLRKLYCVSVPRSELAPEKPKMIHARTNDRWTLRNESSSYNSPVARYLSEYIYEPNIERCYDSVDSVNGARVRGNVNLMNDWLTHICDAHVVNSMLYEQFPVGPSITSDRIIEYVLGYPCDDAALKDVIGRCEAEPNTKDYYASAIYQLFLLSYYLLRRCGINVLKPKHEEWGFDMFQALNATGTPLTAMETFLPQVMKQEEDSGEGLDWERTPSCHDMNNVEKLFASTTSNQEKNRRSDELLTAFALCYEGKKLGTKFSAQRWWLKESYLTKLNSLAERRDYLSDLAQVADLYRIVWHMEDTSVPNIIGGLEHHEDGGLCSLLVQYLRRASATLVAPILARYYCQYIDEPEDIDQFTESIKACAAFFTLWRSAHSTAGLPDVYRKFFRGSEAPIQVDPHSLLQHPSPVPVAKLKSYFSETLRKQGLDTCEGWIARTKPFLLYTEIKTVCRFVLFLSGHQQVKDENNPGLTEPAKSNVCDLLHWGAWISKEFKSIEHVAPRNPPNGHEWDSEIYVDNRVNQIGNLLLFPEDINNRIGNSRWADKYFHYQYVGSQSRKDFARIRDDARERGVSINSIVAKMLSQSEYNCTVAPITHIGVDGAWNADMIDRRTDQMKRLAWRHLADWLGLAS